MKRVLLAGVIAIGTPVAALGAETATYCGPSSGMGCEDGTEQMIFLNKQMNVSSGTGTTKDGTVIDFSSDGGMLNMFIDLANGFATITPAHGNSTYNGLDISVPGFTFTKIVFDEQLTPSANPTDNFTVTGTDAGTTITPIGMESDAPDTDKEFSITAVGGVFTDVNIDSLTGFDEMKHFEIEGLAPIVTSVPEPGTVAILGLGLLCLGFAKYRSV